VPLLASRDDLGYMWLLAFLSLITLALWASIRRAQDK
jgi:hypothetical protein